MHLNIHHQTPFAHRHHGNDLQATKQMLDTVGVDSLEELIAKTVPASIRLNAPLKLPAALTEEEVLLHLKDLGAKNKVFRSYIGMGYYGTYTPKVILRNILENPGWYTAYTPYQAEVAQGRLEMLLNFQTMVIELTGMEVANASLLDEATAAAEAVALMHSSRPRSKAHAEVVLVAETCHPQTLELLQTRAEPINIKVEIGNPATWDITRSDVFGVILQYPDTNGTVTDFSAFVAACKESEIFVGMATDLMALTLLTPPGEMGADVVFGSAQRFGVPMGYGGPHAAFFATRDSFKRNMPGRIIGVSIDAKGQPAYRMALQTREQHIRREKATSNICTAQVLLAVMAAAYGVYHGPEGLKAIAGRIHGLTQVLHNGLKELGYQVLDAPYFDTLKVSVPNQGALKQLSTDREINLRYFGDEWVGISLDETTTLKAVETLLEIFAELQGIAALNIQKFTQNLKISWPGSLIRKSSYLQFPVFNQNQTEHEMLRYLKRLENKDISLTHSMISLGSCTMKLNATTEMIPVTWPEYGGIHPFAPIEQAKGYQELFANLEAWLSEITGFAATSLQPNSGAQGEYAGLMVIRAYHQSRGEGHRNIALIPSSAHGTNPASAVMAGMKVVVVKCDERGNIDLADLEAKANEHSANLAALMVTYPSTHGVFEDGIKTITSIIHKHGGQVYMDGANMNAQVGLTSPGAIGADVCHLNLHKTFCIPHGGGGPGMGPICVAAHLAPFLPSHNLVKTGGKKGITAVSAAPWGSASILLISYTYIAMMGSEGLTEATSKAILNANYIKAKLEKHFSILYTGENGFCAHEMIVDLRQFKMSAGIEVEDIAKRLMDYGYHAPTVSFPVAGTIMIEPTESETKTELDRFCDALINIRHEITEIETGEADKADNVLKNAPHTAHEVIESEWSHSYSRTKAAFPMAFVRAGKVWPTVSRIDSAYGDRHLVCSCQPIEEYIQEEVNS